MIKFKLHNVINEKNSKKKNNNYLSLFKIFEYFGVSGQWKMYTNAFNSS